MKAKGERHPADGKTVYSKPRIVRRPDGRLQTARVPMNDAGKLLDQDINWGIEINASGEDKREIFKQAHDAIDQILEQKIIDVE